MGKPLKVDIDHTLKNMLKMYAKVTPPQIVALEAIANGLDACAKKISITFKEDGNDSYVIFHNDGKPMNKKEFDDYHTISASTKQKGKGIGFAGVGAKIFLAAFDAAEIITITGKGTDVLASRMYNNPSAQYDSTLENIPLEQIVDTKKIDQKYGTMYKVKYQRSDFIKFRNDITEFIQYWFNYLLTAKKVEIKVEGKVVEPWQPKGDLFKKVATYKKKQISCYILIAKSDIPETKRHIIYYAYGKRIMSEIPEFIYHVKDNQKNKICCMADVTVLADHLTTNKEEFESHKNVGDVKKIVRKIFRDLLVEHRIIVEVKPQNIGNNVMVNELTKRLDKIFQNPKFKFLNPFSNPSLHYIPAKDKDGNIVITEVDGKQKGKGSKGNSKRGDGLSSVGDQEGTGYTEDDEGLDIGKRKPKKTRGVSIQLVDEPDDPRESWVDDSKVLTYNEGHMFNKKFKDSYLFEYHFARECISALIRDKSDQVNMNPATTLKYAEQIFQEAWL